MARSVRADLETSPELNAPSIYDESDVQRAAEWFLAATAATDEERAWATAQLGNL
jgi:hypothetical protein